MLPLPSVPENITTAPPALLVTLFEKMVVSWMLPMVITSADTFIAAPNNNKAKPMVFATLFMGYPNAKYNRVFR